MTREKQLAKNTLIIAIGKICTQFASFSLLPLYTSFLSSEEYGTVDLLNTYSSLMIPIIFFQMEQGVFRFLIDNRKDRGEQRSLVSTAIISSVIHSLIFVAIYLAVSIFIDSPYKHFLAVNVIAMGVMNILLQIRRGLGDNLGYSIASLCSGLTTILLNVLFIAHFKWGAFGMLSATLIGNLVSMLYLLLIKKTYRLISIKDFSRAKLKEIWKYSIPLIPNQLSWWVINASDRTVIRLAIDVAANGVYSAANKFSSIITTCFNIFNLTWSESVALHIKDGDADKFFTSITTKAIKLFTMICFGIIACMPFAFSVLIKRADYADAYCQIPILLLSTIFNIFVSLMGSVYVALKKSKEIAKTSAIAAIINLIVNILLIKFIGLYAASISTLVAFLSMSIYRYVDVQKYVKIKLNVRLVLGLFVLGSYVIMSYYLNVLWLNIVTLAIVTIIAFVLNYDLLSAVLNVALSKIMSSERK